MKKLLSALLAAVMLSTTTGCFGEFALVKNLYEWNDNVSDNKFVKTLLFYGLIIVPVYEVAGIIDFWILNLIEFWTGDNPVSMKEGEFQKQIIPLEGKEYIVEATKNRFKIYPAGSECEASYLYFDESDYSWSIASNGFDQKLIALEITEEGEFYRIYEGTESFLVSAENAGINGLTASAVKLSGTHF